MDDCGWQMPVVGSEVSELNDIRGQIDDLDDQIARLLNQRLELARQAGRIKSERGVAIHDAGREDQVLARASRRGSDLHICEAITKVYKELLSQSCRLQAIDEQAPRALPNYFPSVCIVGLGLIGGAMARQIKKLIPETVVTAVDAPDVLNQAIIAGAIDEGVEDLTRAVKKASLIILAAPPDENLKVLRQISSLLRRRQLVVDLTSTKKEIEKVASELDLKADFIGGHPLMGNEKRGFVNSGLVEVDGKSFCIVPSETCSEMSIKRLSRWLSELRLKVHLLDAETHDAVVARSSHMIQLLAVAAGASIVNNQNNEMLAATVSLAGPSLKQLSRLMSSPPELWVQILNQNKPNVRNALQQLIDELNVLQSSLISGDAKQIKDSFQQASKLHMQL
jgi:prephenate dehydrogenase